VKVGFVTLVGKPNVGKSTLLNTIVGQKVSIVSDKAQTTRRRLLGIATTDRYQIVFVDTPGVHEPHTQLGKILNKAAEEALAEADVILVVADSSKKPDREDEAIAAMVRRATSTGRGTPPPVLLCLNKMDLLKAHHVEENVEAYCDLFGTEAYMLTTMTRGHNADKLVDMLVERLPESEPLFPEDEITDQPMRLLAAEIIRERALRLTRQEVPHALATIVDEWEEKPGVTRISASIVVEKAGQKAIIIGKGGAMLKRIGSEAREEIEAWTGTKVYLELFVKVRTDWRQNPRMLRDLEYS
jgi:GTP-binding protein Era